MMWKNSMNHFRIREGGVTIGSDTYKEVLMNEYHYSPENQYTTFSSFILPKGSPLKVSFDKHQNIHSLINVIF